MGTPKTTSWRFYLSSITLALLLPATCALAEEPDGPKDYEVAGLTATILVSTEQVTMDASIFTVDGDWAPWSIELLADELGLEGVAMDATVPDGAQVVLDGDLALTVMADGAADFTDAAYDHAEDAITPVDEQDLSDAADQLLTDLAADELQLYSITANAVIDEDCRGSECVEGDVGRQKAVYNMRLDDLKCFGRGGKIAVRFSGDTEPVGFTHSVRGVVPSSRILVAKPIHAVKGWMLRIANELPWNDLQIDLGTPETIQIVGVSLGYIIPPMGAEATELRPVYQIQAYVGGVDENGDEYDDVVIEWYEPADRI